MEKQKQKEKERKQKQQQKEKEKKEKEKEKTKLLKKTKDLKIIITEEYKIQLILISTEGKETIFELKRNIQEYIPCIRFEVNEIIVCEENENAIYFFEEWITKPNIMKLFTISFQQKEYEVLPEVLFALIINQFKKKMEKKYIIGKTTIENQSPKKTISNRIRISLQAIGLKINRLNTNTDYDYSVQGTILQEILEKQEEHETFKGMMDRAKKTASQEVKKELRVSKENVFDEGEFNRHILKFSTKELCRKFPH